MNATMNTLRTIAEDAADFIRNNPTLVALAGFTGTVVLGLAFAWSKLAPLLG